MTLRRRAHALTCAFLVVFVVAGLRAQALASAIGDETCIAMGGTLARAPTPTTDPSDLADPCHACCDLGLCAGASALPPSEPARLAAPHAFRIRVSDPARPTTPRRRRRRGPAPRAPPAL
jgi:hypothetical protein